MGGDDVRERRGDDRGWTVRSVGLGLALALGALTALAGVATIVVAHAVWQPAVADGVVGVSRAFADAERGLVRAEARLGQVDAAVEAGARLAARLDHLGEQSLRLTDASVATTGAMAAVMRSSAEDMRMMADTVEVFIEEEGLVGTARRLDAAAGALADMERETAALGAAVRGVRAGAATFGEAVGALVEGGSVDRRAALSPAGATLADARDRLGAAPLPLYAALALDVVGLFLLAVGVLLCVVSLLAFRPGYGAERRRAAAAPRQEDGEDREDGQDRDAGRGPPPRHGLILPAEG